MECVQFQGDYPGLSNCSASEMIVINEFKAYTAVLLQQAFDLDTENRAVWAPACAYHCMLELGGMADLSSVPY